MKESLSSNGQATNQVRIYVSYYQKRIYLLIGQLVNISSILARLVALLYVSTL